MADGSDREQDRLGEKWASTWEDQCVEQWETETNMDDKLQTETETSSQKLWLSFQNSASNISNLYKEGSHQNCVSLWVPFQNSAGSVTLLYKDSQDACRRNLDLGVQYGSVRKTKEILNWARKRRRNIRREDLIAFLCGRAPPVRHRPASLSRSTSRVAMERSSPRLHVPSSSQSRADIDEPDLQPFRDALALQGLSGAMSNIGIRGAPAPEVSGANAAAAATHEFHSFILDEMSRRLDSTRKRTSSAKDVLVDSPTRKRSRLL